MPEIPIGQRTVCADLSDLIPAARSAAPVTGLTHNFYRYPARFSPEFVRAALLSLSQPGDWVLDPFAGGGTTLVEAMAHGRNALGVDISSLATFVSEAKTLLLDEREVTMLRRWAGRLPEAIDMRAPGHRFDSYAEAGYYRNIEGTEYWRLKKAIEQVLASIVRLRGENGQTLARCILLKTSQWALDSRKTLPTVPQFRKELVRQAGIMIAASENFGLRVNGSLGGQSPRSICLNRPVAGLEQDQAIADIPAPKLVITSPPYPGVHVLYHRWQVDGRKETPAPFWIANKLDGAGLSHYTMGDRKQHELRSYFDGIEKAFQSVAKVCGPGTTIVQMVAFSQPEWQLPRYLEVMRRTGFSEIFLPALQRDSDGRLWRSVPNRRWHAEQQGKTPSAQEVVLIHQI